MQNNSIIEPSSSFYEKYYTWGMDYVSTLGNRLIAIGTDVKSSKNVSELKVKVCQGFWSVVFLPVPQARQRFRATMEVQKGLADDQFLPPIHTSLHIGFEGSILPVWPTLHRTHVITNHEMITSLLQETRGGKLLDFGDYESFSTFMSPKNMLMCDYEDHTKLRRPLERSFTHRSISSEQMMSKILSAAKQSVSELMDIDNTVAIDYNKYSSELQLDSLLEIDDEKAEQSFNNHLHWFWHSLSVSEKIRQEILSGSWYHWPNAVFPFVNLVSLGLLTDDTVDKDVLEKLISSIKSTKRDEIQSMAKDLRHLNSSDDSLISKLRGLSDDEQESTLLLLLFAASMTTNESIESFMNHIRFKPEFRERIINEFREYLLTEGMRNLSGEPSLILDLIGSESESLLQKYITRTDTILHYCYLESLRLLPAIPVVRRKANEDFNIGETQVFKGDLIELNIMAAQRDKLIWGADAAEFNPERFRNDPEKQKLLNNFSRGKTPCLGKHLAEMEIKTMGLLFCNQVTELKTSEKQKEIRYSTSDGLTLHSTLSDL